MSNEKEINKARVSLIAMHLKVISLPESEVKTLLLQEIQKAKTTPESENLDYAKVLCKKVKPIVRSLRIRNLIFPRTANSNIQLILRGVILYCFIIFLFGICVVVISTYTVQPKNWLVRLVGNVGLNPLFDTVIKLKIAPTSYMIGLFGGAGAVVSLFKRLDEFSKATGSPWYYFSLGFFSPIVGSLAAIVVCSFVSSGGVTLYQGIAYQVIAFFSGFSERLLNKVDEKLK